MTQKEFVDFEVEGLDLENTTPMEGGEFKLVPQGTYKVEVTGVDQDENKNQKPYVEVEFTISEGQDTEEAAAFTGQKLWENYYLTDKGKRRLVQLMMACKAPLDKFRASAIFGAQIIVDVYHSEGQQTTDEQGNVRPARTFANVCKERPIEGEVQATPPPTPPAAKAGGAKAPAGKPTQNGAASQPRRA